MGNIEKLCVICGEDCSTSPRTKDKKGRYYHQACYERAKQNQAAHRAAAAVKPPPPAPPPALEEALSLEPDALNMLDELVIEPPVIGASTPGAGAGVCPTCAQALSAGAVICLNCGFSLEGGTKASTKVRKPKKEKRESSVDWASYLWNPLTVSGAYAGINVILMLALKASPDNEMLALAFLGVFLVTGLVINIMVLVFAFMEGIGHGLLTLCLPFYVFYFAYAVCESYWVKYLFSANLLTNVLFWFIIGTTYA